MERDTGSNASVITERGNPKFHAGTVTEENMDSYINTTMGQKSSHFDVKVEEGDMDAHVDVATEQEKTYPALLKQLDADIALDHPPTQLFRKFLIDWAKENILEDIAAVIEKNGKKDSASKERNTGERTKGCAEKIKDTDETEKPIEVEQSLKSKWRQLEESDLEEVALMKSREVGCETVPVPKVGQQSKYVEVLQKLASRVVVKKVKNKPSPVAVGADGADNFLETARAIAGPGSIIQLAYLVKHLIVGESDDSDPSVPRNLHAGCYDRAGGLNNFGIIVQNCIDIIPIETSGSITELRHRDNCVRMAELYEQEKLKRRRLRKPGVSGLGRRGRGKGVATLVKQEIISLINCKGTHFDGWIKLGKALTPFVDEFGLGILAIFPFGVSNHQILHLPIKSLPLIVSAINDLYPDTKALSVLIEKHLLQHLLNQSSPDPATLRAMLDQAKAMNLWTPLTSVIGSMKIPATAKPDNQASPGPVHGDGGDEPSGSYPEQQSPSEPQTEDGAPAGKRKNEDEGSNAGKKPKVQSAAAGEVETVGWLN